jgi:23S rRNA pseudouridine2457 synthase
MHRYFILHKPFQTLSQFSSEAGKKTLKDIIEVPSDIYPVGRLDYDSEGLLILTNDPSLNHQLLDPLHSHQREYWVQVEGSIGTKDLEQLSSGVDISIDGKKYHTRKCEALRFDTDPQTSERRPPIRYRKNIPTSWLRLIMTEGKNRQVRKMTAAVGFPTLRLIRYRIEKITIEVLLPGELRELEKKEIYRLLNIGG